MTNAQGVVVIGMLGIDWDIMRTCMLVSARTQLSWTHNFFILDKGCPTLTWRWCFFHRRQTVSYPRESGSHLALTGRRSSILAIGGFITRSWTRLSTSRLSGVEKVSRVHSTGKSLDRLSTTIWAGVGQVNWAHDLHRSLTSGLKLNSKSWMSNAETCKYNVQSRMSEAKT